MMMNKKQSSFAHLGKYMIGVPVVILLATVFTLSKAQQAEGEFNELYDEQVAVVEVLSEELVEPIVSTPNQTVRTIVADTIRRDSTRIAVRGIQLTDDKQKQLFVVNGEIARHADLSTIPTNQIESISVLKGDAATALYPQEKQAVHGVIILTTKIDTDDQQDPPVRRRVEGKALIVDSMSVQIVTGRPMTERKAVTMPYILIDGEEGDLSSLEPERIQSIEVIKGETAILEFGAAGRHGMIKVITKK